MSGEFSCRGATIDYVGTQRYAVSNAVSAIFTEPDPSARNEIAEEAAKPPSKGAKRRHDWPLVVITLGLLATLTWSGFLVWAAGRLIGVW
jgi:hypothetical protein